MRRVPPSALVREEIDRLLSGGVERGGNIVSELASLGLRYLAQQGLEQEQQDQLGRGRYERRAEAQEPGWRNGYEDARIRTAEGAVAVRVPQVRSSPEPYRSKLMEFLSGNSRALETLVTEMYARGLSTRDVEDCFRDPDGELLISRTAVSEITDRLWEDYQAFSSRDLSGIDVEYLFVDAVYESLRRRGAKDGVLCAWCITTSGTKVLLGLTVGAKESQACWTTFLRDMVSRGLRAPTSVTSDGAPGLINAIAQVFGESLRIRCWFHRMANIRAKLPPEAVDEFLAHARAVRDAPTLEAGEAMAASLIDRFGAAHPSAVACFADDLQASLAHLRLPARHRINVRTTNLIERSFVEERRRTKVIPRFTDERSAMKLVFAVLIRAADRWCRVSVSELERQQLRLLRRELGLDPPPADEGKETARKRRTAA